MYHSRIQFDRIRTCIRWSTIRYAGKEGKLLGSGSSVHPVNQLLDRVRDWNGITVMSILSSADV